MQHGSNFSAAIRGAPYFAKLQTIAMVEARIEHKDYQKGDHCAKQQRYYISSRQLSPEQFAEAVRNHWGIEANQLSIKHRRKRASCDTQYMRKIRRLTRR